MGHNTGYPLKITTKTPLHAAFTAYYGLKTTLVKPLVSFPHATYFFYTYCEKLKPRVGENGNIFALGLYDTLIMVAV